MSLTSSPTNGRSEVGVESVEYSVAEVVALVLEGFEEVEVVRSEVGGSVGRAFFGKVVEMRIGSSESRR